MRWYRLRCCKGGGENNTDTVWGEHIVQACGVIDAFHKARLDGWWPVEVIASDWHEAGI